jgi:hypothetical protein
MSTRTNIYITSRNTKIWLYRHYDGYPSETGYNLASCLCQSKSIDDFMLKLLDQKHEPTMYRDARPVYEFTTGMHGDIEYLYRINFYGTRIKTSGVNFLVQERIDFGDVDHASSWKEIINEDIEPLEPKVVSEKLKSIVTEKLKVA